MLTLNSTYLQVQAIRRRLRDEGVPTLARPYIGYHAICNLPAGVEGSLAQDTVELDSDSYFAWISTYLFITENAGPYNPDTTTGNGESQASDPVQVRMENLQSGKRYHAGEFIEGIFFDWWQGARAGALVNAPIQSEFRDGDSSTFAIGTWRCPWPEPELLNPSDKLRFTARVGATDVAMPAAGVVFILVGVRLYPGRI